MLVISTVEHYYLVVDICYLLNKYQLHVSALMAIFRLNELTKKKQTVIFGMHLIYGGGVFLLDGVRDLVCIEWGGGRLIKPT